MIVTCNACQTRFRVPEERLGPRGARIRCSRCQAVFVVTPPGDAAAGGPGAPPPSGLAPRAAPPVPPDDPFAPPAPAADPFAPPAPGADPFAPSPAAAPLAPGGGRAPPPVPADDPFAAPPRRSETTGARALDGGWDPFGVTRPPPASPAGDGAPGAERPGEASGGLTLESGGLELSRGGRLSRGGLDLDGGSGPALGDAGFELESGLPPAPPPADGVTPPPEDLGGLDGLDGFGGPALGAGLLGEEPEPAGPVGPVGPQGILDDFGAPEPLPPQEGLTGVGSLPAVAGVARPPPLQGTGTASRPTPVLAPARVPGPPRSRAGAVVVNALSLALLLALAGLLIRAGHAGEGWGLWGRARSGPVAARGVGGGVYETAAGAPVLVIRGEVRAQQAVSGPVRVQVDLLDADQVVASSTALAGAVATPEEVWTAELPDGLAELRRALDARAASALARGASAPFQVLFPAPPGLHGLRLRVTAAAGGPGAP